MIGEPPLKSVFRVDGGMVFWPRPWGNFFTQIWQAIGWKHAFYAALTHDFGSISAQSQATQTVTVTGAAVGDAAVVRPTTAVNGIMIDGTVTAANTVTVRAVNYSSGAIDPAEQDYLVIVIQQ